MIRSVQSQGGDCIRNKCLDILCAIDSKCQYSACLTEAGITELMKLAHQAELNHLGFEAQNDIGGTASLHVLLAVNTTGFYKKTIPEGNHHEAAYPGVYLDPVQVDKEGYVHAPKKPGLGFEIDFNEAKKVTVETIKA